MLKSPQDKHLKLRATVFNVGPPETFLDAFEAILDTSYDNYATVVVPCASNGLLYRCVDVFKRVVLWDLHARYCGDMIEMDL